MNFRERIGLYRSIAMYYWKPFNKSRLKHFYAPFVQRGALCFDVGAHLGNRSNAWLALGASVVAVEPQPVCIEFLERKFKNKDRFTLVKKAIGAVPGNAQMYLSAITPTVSTLANKDWRNTIDADTSFDVQWEQQIPVEIITLDDLITSYGMPVFTKIDIENYEVEALQGLSQALPALSLEFYPSFMDRAKTCIDLLEALGNYEYNWSFGESQKMNSTSWLSAKELKTKFDQITKSDPSGDFYARLGTEFQ